MTTQGGAPHESASRHMLRGVPRAAPGSRAGAVRALLTDSSLEFVDAVYVSGPDDRLLGLLPLRELLRLPDDAPVGEHLTAPAAVVAPECDQERVAGIAVLHGISSVPVVDEAGRLLGVVPPGAIIEVLRREHVEDLHRLAGIQRESDHARDALEEPPRRRLLDRLPWLLVGLAGSMLATYVMTRFERLLGQRVAVAFFIPGIVYLADAIGTQTEAIAVRGLSLTSVPFHRLLIGELSTGSLIGGCLAMLAMPVILLGFGDARLTLAVGLAILAAGTVATGIGLLLPWLLARHGVDPAFGSGPVATIIQDVLSILIYFAAAESLLRG